MRGSWKARRKRQYKFWWPLVILLAIMALIILIGRLYKGAEIANTEARTYKQLLTEKDQRIEELASENKELEIKARVALAQSNSPTLSEEGFNTLVALLFPPKAAERYKKIVTTCENSSRDPKRININKDGSVDLGVSQINEKYHASRVKKIFNEDFWSAMGDSVKNIVYAAWIYQDQGNFSAWTCDRLVSK